MFPLLLTLVVLASPAPQKASTSEVARFLGTWEGDSLCTVLDSPCHDEHVVYEIKLIAGKPAIDAYKIVDGKKLFMGQIACKDPQGSSLSCSFSGGRTPRPNEWVFTLVDGEMRGTLFMDEARTVFRRIAVHKK